MYVRRENSSAFDVPRSGSDHPRRQVSATGVVDDHGPLPTMPQVQSAGAQPGDEPGRVPALAPGGQGRPADGVERGPGPLLSQALGRRQWRDRSRRPGRARPLQPVGDLDKPLLSQVALDGPGMLRPDGPHAELPLDDAGELLPPRVIPGQVRHPARRQDQGVHPVLVGPPVFQVLDTAVRLPGQTELRFEKAPPSGPSRRLVGDAGVGIQVHVVDWPVGAAACGQGDELPDLLDEVRAAQPAHGDDGHTVVLGLQEMPRQRVAGALPRVAPEITPDGARPGG